MDYGIYTAPERVERAGVLICFEGERMTMEEARRRGLVGQNDVLDAKAVKAAPVEVDAEAEAVVLPDERIRKLVNSKTVKELEAMAEALGVKYPKGATKAVIAENIVAAEQRAVSEG